jgi:maltose alpha-D-glucosyltransferase/alpha-amylase
MLDAEYPEAALVSEWSAPHISLKAGFHADFLLDHEGSGYKSLLRDYKIEGGVRIAPGSDHSFFKNDGGGDITRFLDQYLPWYEGSKNDGYISLITGNHDTGRVAANLTPGELALAYVVLFTLPGVPFLYYGDEIGMMYLPLPTKEGGYTRTGSRTPMQWTAGKNKGFSQAPAEKLYLPTDPRPDAPNVEAQKGDPGSLLNTLKAILALRRDEPDLQAKPNLEILYAKKNTLPFIYRRGAFVLAVNPGGNPVTAAVQAAGTPVYAIGRCGLENGICTMDGQSFGVWRRG